VLQFHRSMLIAQVFKSPFPVKRKLAPGLPGLFLQQKADEILYLILKFRWQHLNHLSHHLIPPKIYHLHRDTLVFTGLEIEETRLDCTRRACTLGNY
jgi:hypothetical protein